MVASACGGGIVGSDVPSADSGVSSARVAEQVPPPEPDPDLYDPVAAGESLPDTYRQLLRRDAIFPVYDPSFVTAEAAEWDAGILVVGVDLEGESRAYPIGFLNRREIVVDLHRGIPTLVTW